MSSIDKITRDEIKNKVDVVFKDIRKANTPEEVVSRLVELSDFIDKENLTPQQLNELSGIGNMAIMRHYYYEFFDRLGVMLSLVTASILAGTTITALYLLYESGNLFNYFGTLVLLPFVVMPLYLLFYGKKWNWFSN
ncbi:hypothetical protein CUJ83_07115 [Methanocella sp. CWC-04]|uniref:Uncharacterized protein n=1 Tax=Methanooceanicella nereidis TaxID=2052831 RepID=A0AAP2REM1_9EURY|nr:hypothetical protein [Methanocella sp. CWC-04]MCD1294767.1 hypothetical protein [Methanocella sp. CWC-04]